MDHLPEPLKERLAQKSTQFLYKRERQSDERQVLVTSTLALLYSIPRIRGAQLVRVQQGLATCQEFPSELQQCDNQKLHLFERV